MAKARINNFALLSKLKQLFISIRYNQIFDKSINLQAEYKYDRESHEPLIKLARSAQRQRSELHTWKSIILCPAVSLS